MRDWKEISKVSADAHPGGVVLLESPHYPVDALPEGSVRFYHPELTREIETENLTPKDIRRFLWENRANRAVLRDRSFVETDYDEESGVSTVRLGTITADAVLERMKPCQ